VSALLRWVGVTALVAVLVHLASTWYLPRFIMARAMDGLERQAGGSNTLFQAPLATAASRAIVRPSPDLLYSICVVDVSGGPVRVRALPSQPYSSVSVFAANSDNVFVMNDRYLAPGAAFELWIARSDQKVPLSAPVAMLRSNRGLVLVRRVLTDPAQSPALEALRGQASCKPA
jgi:uncharacterized membrane protein